MRTVKEISDLTGVSVRTLHYYDEIGLMRPTMKSAAGYRLYDDEALEQLRQVLFFRELDMPLQAIKEIIQNPTMNRERVLKMQRELLSAKKERLERLIASVDRLLQGDETMDFAVFSRTDIEEIIEATIERMPEFMRRSILKEFGGIDQWRRHYLDRALKADMQRGYASLVNGYGDKERALEALTHPPCRELGEAYSAGLEAILLRLMEKSDCPPDDPAVKRIVQEYALATKRFTDMQDEKEAMLSVAASYRDQRVRPGIERRFGAGAGEFFARAIEAYYEGG